MSPYRSQEANLKQQDEGGFAVLFLFFNKQKHDEANCPEISEDLAKIQMALKSA